MGAESFTLLAILEARDRASEIFAKVDESLGKFSETAKVAADTATAAGDKIDEGLLKTASGADALDVASARVSAAQARAAETAKVQAAWEKELLSAQKAAAEAADGDATAQARLSEAGTRAAAAAKENAAAQKDLAGAQKLQADTAAAAAAKNDEAAASTVAVSGASKESAISLTGAGKVAGVAALGLGVAAGVMVKAAGNFQDSTAHLQTDAGVTAQNLGMIRANILQVSTATGQSAGDITNAMYHIASSGFTGANSLGILKAAAEGARVGGADLDTTSKALVGTMTAYYGTSLTAAQATKYSTSLMNQLITTVGTGDMRMQDLASSLSAVTPVAAAAGISFAQVGGAVATMTAQGMTAQQATQDLANTIRNLKSPNNVASQEMRALGLNANAVSKNLGKAGLAGTLNQLRDAVLSNTSGGDVMLGYLKEMSPAAQSLSNQVLAGSISTGDLTKAMKTLNPEQAALVTHFKAAAVSATGLKQTYTGAMSKMLGGATGLNTALMLTGKHMSDLTSATGKIAAEGKKASGAIDNWSTIQGTFNFKVSQAKTAVENTGIAIGSALLPAVSAVFSSIAKVLVPVAEWTGRHQKLTEILFASVTGVAALVAAISLAAKAFKAVSGAVSTVRSAVSGTISLFKKLGGAAKTSAAEQEAASGEAAAAAEADAGEAAAANEAAAAESSGSWVAAAARTVAGWAAAGAKMTAQGAAWAAKQAAQVTVVVAKNAAGAAVTAGTWVMAGARQAAAGALWVAQGIGKVAVIVGANVAGAAVTAAAWVVANAVMLLGIGLLIAAVVAAVVLIVKNWGRISAAAKVAFHDVTAAAETAIGWVKAHWPLLLAILTGPVGLAVLMIKDHFKQVKDGALDVVHFIENSFRALLNLDATLRAAGIRLVMGLVHGIESVAMAPVHAVESIVGDVRSLLPFSPAKKGPLSGGGSPDIAGAKFATMFAGGIASAAGTAASAARLMAAGVSSQVSAAALGHSATAGITSSLAASAIGPASGAGGSGVVINLTVSGNTVMSDSDINLLVGKIGKKLSSTTLPAAGRKLNIRG